MEKIMHREVLLVFKIKDNKFRLVFEEIGKESFFFEHFNEEIHAWIKVDYTKFDDTLLSISKIVSIISIFIRSNFYYCGQDVNNG